MSDQTTIEVITLFESAIEHFEKEVVKLLQPASEKREEGSVEAVQEYQQLKQAYKQIIHDFRKRNIAERRGRVHMVRVPVEE